jgi:hypothetical protein
MKRAKDGTARGRPPLYGVAGRYDRVYADVAPEVAERLRAYATTRGTSCSRVVADLAESEFSGRELQLRPGGVRIYSQIRVHTVQHLRAEAMKKDWSIATLLGALAFLKFSRAPLAARLAT